MRSALPILVVMLSLVGAQGGAAPQATPPRPTGGQSDRVVLRYNPSELKDPDFAALARALADATPLEGWPTITVRSKEGLFAVIDRAYDFFLPNLRDGGKAAPETTAELVRIIREANDLSDDALEVGQQLKIPPMLARPQPARGPASSWLLSSDPGTLTAAVVYEPRKSSVYGGDGEKGVRPNEWLLSNDIGMAGSGAVDIALSLPVTQAEFLRARNVGVVVPRERVALELLQSSDCVDAFPPSPYTEMARERLRDGLPSIVAGADRTPLMLIDYGFGDGHGGQVRGVVDRLLENLGLTEVTAPNLWRAIDGFELKPPAPTGNSPLLQAMGRYTERLRLLNKPFRDQRANASDWYLHPDEAEAGGTVIPIAPFALQAAVNHGIQRGAWLNLSWRGDSVEPVMPEGLDALLKTGSVFAVAAAGNRLEDIQRDRAPQDKSSLFSEFVNVTNGTSAGLTCGTRTSTTGARVQLLAEGVGIDGSGKKVSGSSFAAPIVAAAAWLKHLLDGTPAGRMRERLVAASAYLPALDVRTVDARGPFDPWKLLAGAGLHYVDAGSNTVVRLKDMTLDMGSCGRLSSIGTSETTNDLVVYASGGGHRVAIRSVTPEFPHVAQRPTCDVDELRFTATTLAGETKTETTPEGFVRLVRQLQF
jgi:hypothetical protein